MQFGNCTFASHMSTTMLNVFEAWVLITIPQLQQFLQFCFLIKVILDIFIFVWSTRCPQPSSDFYFYDSLFTLYFLTLLFFNFM